MLHIQIYDRQGIVWDSKLEFISDNISEELFSDLEDVYNYIDSMLAPEYKKTAYKNRIHTIVDWCYPKHFYKIVSKP